MKDTELAYIAGLFDGDGCVCILKEKQGKYRLLRIEASIQNTDLDVIEYLKSCFGGRVWHRKLPSGKTFGAWALSCRKAVEFLEKIGPFLRIKKDRAILATKIYSITSLEKRGTRRNGKGQFQKISEEERNRVNVLAQEIKQLNHGGIHARL